MSGKTTIINKILGRENEDLRMDYDRVVAYGQPGSIKIRDKLLPVNPYGSRDRAYEFKPMKSGDRTLHTLYIFDDPPMRRQGFMTAVNELYKQNRHKGITPIFVVHNVDDFSKYCSEVASNAMTFVFTKRAISMWMPSRKLKFTNMLGGEPVYNNVLTSNCDYAWVCRPTYSNDLKLFNLQYD
jgi:hypothetical protein